MLSFILIHLRFHLLRSAWDDFDHWCTAHFHRKTYSLRVRMFAFILDALFNDWIDTVEIRLTIGLFLIRLHWKSIHALIPYMKFISERIHSLIRCLYKCCCFFSTFFSIQLFQMFRSRYENCRKSNSKNAKKKNLSNYQIEQLFAEWNKWRCFCCYRWFFNNFFVQQWITSAN